MSSATLPSVAPLITEVNHTPEAVTVFFSDGTSCVYTARILQHLLHEVRRKIEMDGTPAFPSATKGRSAA